MKGLRQVLSSKIAQIQAVTGHEATKGIEIENAVRNAFSLYIPKRFSVESGFVHSLHPSDNGQTFEVWKDDRQIDVLFTYGDTGLVLSPEQNLKVFPLESILGFMEVTTNLSAEKLHEDFEKVSGLKRQVQRYCYCSVEIAQKYNFLDDESYERLPEICRKFPRNHSIIVEYNDLEPRFYYFAATSKWKKSDTICKNLKQASTNFGVHLHGMLILDQGFFRISPTVGSSQVDYIDDPEVAMGRFMHGLIDSLNTFAKIPPGTTIPLDAYLGIHEVQMKQWSS